MSERSDRLLRAFNDFRVQTPMSIREAAKRFGWNENTFKSNLNGNAPFGYELAKEYAKKFKVRAEWLYDGSGSMREPRAPKRPPQEIPFLSWVSAGAVNDIGQINELEADRLVIGDLPPGGEYFVTEVRGDSMDRISPDGSRIVVNIADKVLVPGKAYVFRREGEATYKRYEADPVQRLEPMSTNPLNRTIFVSNDDEPWQVTGRVVRTMYDLP